MRIVNIIISLVLILLCTACFEEDQAVIPYIPPDNIESISLPNNIYTDQVYFDFSSGQIASTNKNSDWALEFECGEFGYHIKTNTADYIMVARTGSTNIDSIFSDISEFIWRADKSDGNPDSTAVGEWLSFESDSPMYNNEVYIIGRFDGLSYTPLKKVQFIYMDDLSYKIRIGNLDEINTDTTLITKVNTINYIQFSFENNTTIQLEPQKDEWDILFTQYHTILYTEDSIRTPYFVRGVLLNPYNVDAALDSINRFEDINYSTAVQEYYINQLDAIGHDWKSVTVDQASNSAEYKVRPGYTYIIKDTNNDLYKMRFKSFFNDSGQKGYPSFEFAKLEADNVLAPK